LKSEYGKDMIELLLDRDPNIEITEAVVVAAAKNKYGKNMIELLLDRDPNIEITEAVVVAAAGMV
jgi:predicted acetyltransferase